MEKRKKVVDAPKVPQIKQEYASLNAGQSIERALYLLECLARTSGWAGISELSHATGQPVGTIHRLLKTLTAREYVVRDSRTRRYALGPAFRRLAGAGLQTPDWSEIATPFLQELVEVSGETANLAVLERNRAVYEAQAQPSRMVRMFTALGNRVPLHCTGCGKVLLAYQPDSVVASIVAEAGLPRYTESTITDPGHLRCASNSAESRGEHLACRRIRIVPGVVLQKISGQHDGCAVSLVCNTHNRVKQWGKNNEPRYCPGSFSGAERTRTSDTRFRK